MKFRQLFKSLKCQIKKTIQRGLGILTNFLNSQKLRQIKTALCGFIKSIKNRCIAWGQKLLEWVKIPMHFLVISGQLLLYINPFTPHRVNDKNLEAYIVYLKLSKVRSFLVNQKHRTPAFVLLIICFTILLLKSTSCLNFFEGNIIAESVSFTHTGTSNKLFLNSIRNLQRIELEGIQNLTLSGNFQPENLSEFDNLEIQLNYPHSKLIIEPSNPNEFSQLEINAVRLQQDTQVDNLTYYPDPNQLLFTLTPPEEENPEIVVQLSLGQEPLNITLEGYNSPQLNQPEDEFNFLEFVWTPGSTELNLSPSSRTQFYLDLPPLETSNYQEWLWGGLTVSDVRFSRPLRTDNTQDVLELSTILEGKIRMVNKDLNLEERQFLIFKKEPNITTFPRLQIHRDTPQGLQVRIHGKASKIEAGIDPELSVSQINANILDRWLSPEVINFLLTFCAVVIGYLIPWLFTN